MLEGVRSALILADLLQQNYHTLLRTSMANFQRVKVRQALRNLPRCFSIHTFPEPALQAREAGHTRSQHLKHQAKVRSVRTVKPEMIQRGGDKVSARVCGQHRVLLNAPINL